MTDPLSPAGRDRLRRASRGLRRRPGTLARRRPGASRRILAGARRRRTRGRARSTCSFARRPRRRRRRRSRTAAWRAVQAGAVTAVPVRLAASRTPAAGGRRRRPGLDGARRLAAARLLGGLRRARGWPVARCERRTATGAPSTSRCAMTETAHERQPPPHRARRWTWRDVAARRLAGGRTLPCSASSRPSTCARSARCG